MDDCKSQTGYTLTIRDEVIKRQSLKFRIKNINIKLTTMMSVT